MFPSCYISGNYCLFGCHLKLPPTLQTFTGQIRLFIPWNLPFRLQRRCPGEIVHRYIISQDISTLRGENSSISKCGKQLGLGRESIFLCSSTINICSHLRDKSLPGAMHCREGLIYQALKCWPSPIIAKLVSAKQQLLWSKIRGSHQDGKPILRSAQHHRKIHTLGKNMYFSLQKLKPNSFKHPTNNSLPLTALPPVYDC